MTKISFTLCSKKNSYSYHKIRLTLRLTLKIFKINYLPVILFAQQR